MILIKLKGDTPFYPLILIEQKWEGSGGSAPENPPADAGDAGNMGSPLGWDDLLEKEVATHSSILAWEIPWTEEPGGLQSMGLQRAGPN